MIEVIVRKDESAEQAIRRFRKKVKNSNILIDVAERSYYVKKSDIRNRKRRARKRRR